MHQVQQPGTKVGRVVRPSGIDDVLALLAEHGPAARLVAGSTDLLLEMARGGHPGVETLIDLSGVSGLDHIRELDDDRFHIGPLVTHNQIVASRTMWQRATPLAEACFEVGSPQLRNRATVVGNVVTASPANDTISALRVLDAVLTLRSARGERQVALSDFHTGVRASVLADDEMVTGITLRSLADNESGTFLKVGNRVAQAISIVHIALVVRSDESGYHVKAALGSVAPTIVEFRERLADLGDPVLAGFARKVAAALRPIDDVRATATYRTHVTEVVIRRGLAALRDGRTVRPDNPVLLSSTGSAFGSAPPGSFTETDAITVTVNGRLIEASGAVSRTLLDWLRDVAGPAGGTPLTGTKEGCAEGECGACTVLLNGSAVMACLVPAVAAHGTHVTTVEGLASGGELHPVQQAFVDLTAVQCGFCIPGFLVASAALLDGEPRPDRRQIMDGLAGNLCRCTGYYRIIEAVGSAGGST